MCRRPGFSAASMGELINQLGGTTVPINAVVIMDMYGNSSWRWEEENGSLASAVEIGPSYHLLGPELVRCDVTFTKHFEITLPIMKDAESPPPP
jgi:hypothetical protein